MKTIDSYKLPAPVVVALSTGRRELIDSFMELTGVTPVEMAEVFRLLADLIEDRRQQAEKIEQMRQVVKMAAQTSDGNMRRLETAMEELQR